MKDVVIASACRTAIGAFGATLKDSHAATIASVTMKAGVEKASIEPVTKKHGIDELQERLPALLDATGCSWEQAARECLLNLTDGQLVKLLQSLGWVGAAREVVKKSA